MRHFIPDYVLEFAGKFGFYQDIARIEQPFLRNPFTVLDPVDLFGRDKYL